LVNDYANLLSRNENQRLTRKLTKYAQETSTQIVIFTENSLEGGDAFNRALDIFDKWGIGGSQRKSNGVLIYVAKAEQKIRIMTGQGAEGFLPDILSDRIIEQIIVPNFKQNRYYRGLDRATSAIMEIGQGEYTNEQQGQPKEKRQAKGMIPAILIILVILILVLVISRYNRRSQDNDDDGGYYRGGRYDMDPSRKRRRRDGGGGGWWIFPFPFFGGGGWSSGGGDFGGGGGDFGGDDWGDFGGFGGGMTGGGGAGGEW
jgi:uncharacterized protein